MGEDSPYDLLKQDDIAKEIGLVVMYASNVECWLFPAISHLLRGKPELGYAIIQPIENLRAKIDILFNIAEAKAGRPLADDLLAAKDELLKAIAYRNALAHSFYGFSLETGELHLLKNILSGGRRGKPKGVSFDKAEARKHTQTMKAFIAIVREHCGGDVFTGFPVGASPDKPA